MSAYKSHYMGKNYIIYGDTSFAEEIFNIISIEGEDHVIAFTNDRTFISRNNINNLSVIPFDELNDIIKEPFEILLAYGYTKMNSLREKVYEECKTAGMKVGTYVSNKALCYSEKIGEGSIVWPNVYIGPGVSIGCCNIIQASCTFAHDNIIGDFNYFAPGVVLGGRVSVANNCFLGINCTVKSDVHLLNGTLLGCGCNMIHDSDIGRCYYGNPARMSFKYSIDTVI